MSSRLKTAALILIGLKILLALVFPVFGDEAYYFYWGSHFAQGYYDLPPMVGWWLWPFLKLTANPFWARIPNLLVAAAISFGLFELISGERGREEARAGAWLFFFLPLPFLTVISFPDVPLLFFSFFASLLFYRALKSQRTFFSLSMILAGALWGAAFLSKYFAVFLLPAFLVFAWPRSKQRIGGMLSFLAGAAPAVLQHLQWNRLHCWSNFVFNLIVRQKVQEGPMLRTTGELILFCLLVAAPVWIALLSYRRSGLSPTGDLKRYLFLLWWVPLLFFGATALNGRGQGLHWLLFITPFFAGWSAIQFGERSAMRAVRFSMGMSAILVSVLLAAFSFPREFLSGVFQARNHTDFVIITSQGGFVSAFADRIKGTSAFFTDSYSISSFFQVEFGKRGDSASLPPVKAWLTGSRFGRAFDWT
ncbi:MAG: hypothetical protein EBX52_08220, partial [Proteobacteria bacterium]|nr:hypothetical protein [Pseudomonadota bacterium]